MQLMVQAKSLFMPAEVLFFTSTLDIAIQPSNPSGLTVRAPTAQSFDCFPALLWSRPDAITNKTISGIYC